MVALFSTWGSAPYPAPLRGFATNPRPASRRGVPTARALIAALNIFAVACGSSSNGDTAAPSNPAATLPDPNASPSPSPAEPITAPAPPVACGAKLPGPAMMEGAVEGSPGFASSQASTDLSTVPDPLDYAAQDKVSLGLANFMLGRAGGTTVSHADALAHGGLGKTVLAAAAKGGAQDKKLDVFHLRQGLFHHYLCETSGIPKSLEDLVARYGDYKTWPSREIACSRAKNGPRRIHENHDKGIYVAETVVKDSAGAVRETEAIFTKLRTDGQLDFSVYTTKGELTNRSTFATRGSETTLAAPFVCMTCHFDRAAGTFSVLSPTGTGAGCE